jgi:hypothetical protein
LEASELGEQILVARFEEDAGASSPARNSIFCTSNIARAVTLAAAATVFLAAAVLAH